MSDPRFSIIPAGAVLDRRLESRDLQVLCLFGRHTDKKGWCRRSQVVMAKEIGCARSTVQASIERLVDAGWLQKRPAADLHTPGIRDSAHEYRVVLDVADDPQDVVATLPTDRHPPADPVSAPPADIEIGTYVNEPLSNEKTPQPPLAGGQGFADLLEGWPDEHHGNLQNAAGAFDRLEATHQSAAIRLAPRVALAFARRKERIPALVRYLREALFDEFDGGPEIDVDGAFIITPQREEWREWLGYVRRTYGERAVESVVMRREFLPKTRWPPKVPVPA